MPHPTIMTASERTRHQPRTLVVMAHPAPSSLTRSVAAKIMAALEAHGHTSQLADLAAEGFNPVFGPADHAAFALGGQIPDDVREEQRRIDGADHLVLVYPIYWWGMPALLKGWIDRVFVTGWAFDEDADGGIAKKLGRLKVSLVAIGGASGATYHKRGYADAMRVQIEEGIFDFCGAPVVSSQRITADQHADAAIAQTIAANVVGTIVQEAEADA